MTDYTVRSGDTLMKIAAAELGDGLCWTAIYEANKTEIDAAYAKAERTLGGYLRRNRKAHEIHTPSDFIVPGQVLRLPPLSIV